MTATPHAETAKLIMVIGAPDGMPAADALRRFNTRGLDGISGIATTLLPALRGRGHPHAVVMLGPRQTVDRATAEGIVESTGGRVLVNLICEADLHRRSLEQLARLEIETGLATINPAAAIAATTRPVVARRLAHQVGVRVPRCTVYRAGARSLAEHVEASGHRYPVLLRPPGGHGSAGLVRSEGPDELAGVAGRRPAWTVTDFIDFRSEDGLWRKYRMVVAGEHLFRRHVLIDRGWNLTRAARRFMDEHPELAAEERDWVAGAVELDGGSVDARVMHQFRALQLDFGAIDFGLTADGDVVVFEVNACAQLTNRVDEQAAGGRRSVEESNDRILDALIGAMAARADEPEGQAPWPVS